MVDGHPGRYGATSTSRSWRVFEGLPPSDDPKERASRDQIASAVVLYRLLQERMPQPKALDIVAEVVEPEFMYFSNKPSDR